MKKSIHWRKTAKVCPKCNLVRSHKAFVDGIENCASCAFDELVYSGYAQCCYCKTWLKKEEFPKRRHKKDHEKQNSICSKCLQIFRERHAVFKNSPRLTKGKYYICSGCNIAKSYISYPRGSGANKSLLCRCCITNRKIREERKFRCKGCCSVFPIDQIHWNKYCKRCYEKNKEWNKYKLRELRKDPIWAQYFKEMQRHQYYNVFKPIYNKVLALQIANGLAKKRKVNRNGFWYVLNHQLFQDFRKRYHHWDELTKKTINAMKNRNSDYKMEQIIRPIGQAITRKERLDLGLPLEDRWE